VSEPINDIDGLLFLLSDPHHSRYSTALRMLVAERNALKERVAELEANPPADRDRELRERLVCAALVGLAAHPSDSHPMHNLRELAVYCATAADLTLAAMRKEGGGA
jgi:hypothetical protein